MKTERKKYMNKQECDILKALVLKPYVNQRVLSEDSGHSLGVVNRSIKSLIKGGYLDKMVCLTEKANLEFRAKAPKNAIILAAGFDTRMVSIHAETPKGLLEVNGQPLMERTIRQLHEIGIKEIYIVVGFMKEQYEYLIDAYGVELIVNPDYASKNNLHSMALALSHLSNTYIIPCDIWCRQNPYNRYELYSWYMVSDLVDHESLVRANRKMELVSIPEFSGGNAMIGISYLLEEQAAIVRKRVEELCKDSRNDGVFWEKALYEKDKMIVRARVVPAADIVEINTLEQLRELDSPSNQLKSDAFAVIRKELKVSTEQIVDITVLKKGMTNRSFLFTCRGKKYIMRIPGAGTDQLIHRREEAAVYRVLKGKNICDDIIYINPENGYKITECLADARVCNPFHMDDISLCMKKLREFHSMELTVEHEFDIFGQIEAYQTLWGETSSIYKDYSKTKENVFRLKPYIEQHIEKKILTHIDAVPDNFLLTKQGDIRLIDWEYAGMQDPHVDLAMFCIYSLYNRRQVDQLIDLYFNGQCLDQIRIKIYGYISVCGLLWSNWCEYKRCLGVEFGQYSLCQYRFAKDYYKIVVEELKKRGESLDEYN